MPNDVPIDTFGRWQNSTEKRLMAQERQPRIYHAYDLLGPGFGATATELNDWNQEEATFNGFFWSQIDAFHQPVAGHEWVGIAVVESDNARGIQVAWQAEAGDPPLVYMRRFENLDAAPFFTPWQLWTGGGGGGGPVDLNVVTGIQADVSATSITSTLAGPGDSEVDSTEGGIAIGHGALVEAPAGYGVAIGRNADVRDWNGVAIGQGADATMQGDVVIGNGAASLLSSGTTAGHVAIGTGARAGEHTANTDSCVAIGNGAQATARGSIAIGETILATVPGKYAIVIGWKAYAPGDNSIVIGSGDALNDTTANGHHAIGIGFRVQATGNYGVAIGYEAEAGTDASAGDPGNATALGYRACGYQNGTVAVGTDARAQLQGGTCIGGASTAYGVNSTVLGNFTTAEADNSMALGSQADAANPGSVAIGTDSAGNGAQATADNEFVLGTALHTVRLPGRLNVVRRTPTSSADTQGAVGDITSDDNYFYAKTSGGWKRAALSSF